MESSIRPTKITRTQSAIQLSQPGIERVQALADILRSALYAIMIATKTVHRLQIHPLKRRARANVILLTCCQSNLSKNAAMPPHKDGSVLFARCRQCAPLCFLGLPRTYIQNCISIGSAVFAQLTAECPYTLQWAASSPLKTAPLHWGSGPLSKTWFLGPTRVHNPNGISIGSAVFVGLTKVTDRQTDHVR